MKNTKLTSLGSYTGQDLMNATQFAASLVPMFYEEPPSHSTVCRWCRQGRLAGAFKLGEGTSGWIIPRSARLSFDKPKLGPPFRFPVETDDEDFPERPERPY
ncbi:MAG TPA: hypothetical protein VM537_23855 [Anaerolineae bacterium]|nr:hypothetical protein [Anaerolineae bacterium]